MRQFSEDRRKLKELILLISKEAESYEDYGKTHLNKILFFIDFIAYAKFGAPVSGAQYIREKRGPVPRPMRAGSRSPVNELVQTGELKIKSTPLPRNMTRQTPIAQRAADTSVFSEKEIELAKQVVHSFPDWTAGKLSKYTHELPQWHAVPLLETIPYELVFVDENQSFTEKEIQHGLALARQHGWSLSKRAR
jgi:hypothetical protein